MARTPTCIILTILISSKKFAIILDSYFKRSLIGVLFKLQCHSIILFHARPSSNRTHRKGQLRTKVGNSSLVLHCLIWQDKPKVTVKPRSSPKSAKAFEWNDVFPVRYGERADAERDYRKSVESLAGRCDEREGPSLPSRCFPKLSWQSTFRTTFWPFILNKFKQDHQNEEEGPYLFHWS